MNHGHVTGLNSRDLDLLNKIEKLRARLLDNQSIRERISRRAYELYARRGGEPGRDVEDWVQAENEILSPLIEEEMSSAATIARSQKSQAARMNRQTAARKTSGPGKAIKPGAAKKAPSKSKETGPKVLKRESKETAPPRRGKKKVESEPDTEVLNPSGKPL